MTKFMNPSFCSPANNSNYLDNYAKTFGFKAHCNKCDTTTLFKYTHDPENEQEVACQKCKNVCTLA